MNQSQNIRILFLSQFLYDSSFDSGATRVSKLNLKRLRNSFSVVSVTWMKNSTGDLNFSRYSNRYFIFISSFFGLSGGVTVYSYIQLLFLALRIRKSNYIVWMDSSLLGGTVPLFNWFRIPTVVFFHNFEFELVNTKEIVKLKDLVKYYTIKNSEYLSIKHATNIISISNYDANKISLHYGRAVDLILFPVLDDIGFRDTCRSKSIGFIGSDWYPNLYAVEFILELAKLLPDYKFVIAGSICKKVTKGVHHNVVLSGYVDDLHDFYRNVHTILSPVVEGSGIKIKVAEAFQYSKIVIGASHSIKGFEPFINKNYFVAESLEEYVSLIRRHTGVLNFDTSSFKNHSKAIESRNERDLIKLLSYKY